MTPDRFQQIRNLFEAALERRTAERAAFLAEACGNDQELREQADRLLSAHESTVTLSEALPERQEPVRTDPASREGKRLGDYEILRQLGRGGMGSVYLARRADEAFHKNVAIKILRADAASTDLVQRFHREREILAQLDHPNIARLLDAGETDEGLPYFVMEYVEGSPITQYADEARLSVRDRIALFRQVCDAVDYAHQRKVVHRDLKPSNVLATAENQVKLLDFGIARLLEQEGGVINLTRSGMWLMTPEYASPEQVRGEVASRASDVYSLGVILFELLTGHQPYHLRSRIFHEIVRVVCEEPPTRPSTAITQPIEITTAEGKPATLPPETAGRLRQTSLDELKHQLSGNLDNLLLKALEKLPQDRYASAQQLRADMDRHLNGEPVWARGDSPWYKIGRRISRHRVALVILATLAAAVATGSVTLRWSTLAWAAAAAVLIGLWYAATDREAGRRVANNRLLSNRAVLAVIIIDLIAIRTEFWTAAVALAGIAAVQLIGWLTRSRWGGPLILDLRNNLQRSKVISLAYVLLAVLILLVGHDPNRGWYALATLAGASLINTNGNEIRREGFIRSGRLIPWSRIASWSWGPDGKGAPDRRLQHVLILNFHRRLQFLPPVRMRISQARKNEIEAILKRQLGEWPAAGHEEHDR
jgi:serine/threonine protein kinase